VWRGSLKVGASRKAFLEVPTGDDAFDARGVLFGCDEEGYGE
jgi:hypothetical protein